jgi:hypothetical protein
MEAHDAIDNLERQIKEELHIEFVIHMDPVVLDDPIINEMRKIIVDALIPIEGLTNIHDFRIVPGPTHTNILFDAVRLNDCKLSEKEILKIANEAAQAVNPAYFVVITFDKQYAKI